VNKFGFKTNIKQALTKKKAQIYISGFMELLYVDFQIPNASDE